MGHFFILTGLTQAVSRRSFLLMGKKLCILFCAQFNLGKEISTWPPS